MGRSAVVSAILETAEDMRRAGVLDEAGYAKITLRHPNAGGSAAVPMTAAEIRAVRASARVSQAVFARCLNVSTGYVSQLERGVKQPTGAVLALLNVVRRRGIEVVM